MGTGVIPPIGTSNGLVLLEQHTASSSATLDFTASITSAYDDYLIELVNVVPATNTVDLYMRVSTDGGSTLSKRRTIHGRFGADQGTGVTAGAGTGVGFMQFGNSYNNTANWSANATLLLKGPGSALYKSVQGFGNLDSTPRLRFSWRFCCMVWGILRRLP